MARINRVCGGVGGTFTDCLVFEAARDLYPVVTNPETFRPNEARIHVRRDRQ